MRAVPMCFSILQAPRCRIHTLANFCYRSFHNLSRSSGNRSSSFRLLGAQTYGHEGGYSSKRWTRRPISTKTEGRNKTAQSSKPSKIRDEVFEAKVSTSSTTINVNKTEISEFQRLQYCDIQQNIGENKDLTNLVTFIVFDIETTGLSRENERIIEIALQVLSGGENSTFQTLVNPERIVPNSHVHGITTHMVSRPGVPRMGELIPILVRYINSQQKPGGHVVLVAHNARSFDVPFLINEFRRHNYEIPPHWLFYDTLPLAREFMKSGETNLPSGVSLQALREFFGYPLEGKAHTAMSDVNSLSRVFQKLTFVLKMPVSSILDKTFTALAWINRKKKS